MDAGLDSLASVEFQNMLTKAQTHTELSIGAYYSLGFL